jgi:hypothetical protein
MIERVEATRMVQPVTTMIELQQREREKTCNTLADAAENDESLLG